MTAGGNVELRCASKRFHGEVEAGSSGRIRVRCRECARLYGPRIVLIHHFDLATGKVVDSKTYRDTDDLFTQKRLERTAQTGD